MALLIYPWIFSIRCRTNYGDSRSDAFQLYHSLVQPSLGIVLQLACVYYLVEPPHLRLKRYDAPACGRGSGLSELADILLAR